MENRTLLTLLLLVSFSAEAAGQAPGTEETCNVQGAWEMVSVKVIYPDRVDYPEHRQRQVKILTPTHFAFGRQSNDGETVFAGGGRYSVEGNAYTEHIEYHSSAPLVGTAIVFDCRIEGDRWYHSGNIGDFRLEEVWRRIGPAESMGAASELSDTDRLIRMEREASGVQRALREIREQKRN